MPALCFAFQEMNSTLLVDSDSKHVITTQREFSMIPPVKSKNGHAKIEFAACVFSSEDLANITQARLLAFGQTGFDNFESLWISPLLQPLADQRRLAVVLGNEILKEFDGFRLGTRVFAQEMQNARLRRDFFAGTPRVKEFV